MISGFNFVLVKASQIFGSRRGEKAGAMCDEQFWRGAPRGGVATEEAEADESCDRAPFTPQIKKSASLSIADFCLGRCA